MVSLLILLNGSSVMAICFDILISIKVSFDEARCLKIVIYSVAVIYR